MAKCNICNRRWFFSSQVKCDCKSKQLKARATHFPVQRSIQNTTETRSNTNDMNHHYLHQQNLQSTLLYSSHESIEPCDTRHNSPSYQSTDSSPSYCNSSSDSSYSSSSDSSSSSSSWD